MKLSRCFIIPFCCLLFSVSRSQELNPILPAPVQYKLLRSPAVELSDRSGLQYPEGFHAQALYLQEQVFFQTGIKLNVQQLAPNMSISNGIQMILDSVTITRSEMYRLRVSGKLLQVYAKDVRGFVNAVQTILQLIPMKKTGTIAFPAVDITDYPQFAYRGMHLDVVRHMFPLEYVKKYIDYLAFHKFNTFHWHLTDDQGWRFEVLSYPRLNTIGSWRDSTLIGHFKDVPARYDGTRYGGFYTRAEIKEVIEYATVRGINIIPELDIPGHSRATIAAYPMFSTNPDTTWNVATTWGMYNRQNNVLAPNDSTFLFLKTIFTELSELFPSEYIHIGGDECSKLWWKKDSATQRFMRLNKIKSETALQTYFIEYVAGHLKTLGKKSIGWHEIAEGDLDTSTLIMNWADEKQALSAAKKGFDVIMVPGKPFYFDHYQSKDPADSLAIHGYNPLEAVYNYAVVPESLKKANLQNKIAGAQANLWTEYVGSSTKVDYMVFPRMSALSENLWNAKKDYKDFLRRVDDYMIPRYEFWNSSYFKAFRKWDISK
jgi:hexosaminidase